MSYLQFLLVWHMCAPAPDPRWPVPSRLEPTSLIQQDLWFAEDKAKHALMSLAVVNFAHAGARGVGLQDERALIAAALSGAAAGIWKEAFDRRRGRPFSARDLVWDGMGIAVGLLLVSNAR